MTDTYKSRGQVAVSTLLSSEMVKSTSSNTELAGWGISESTWMS